MEKLLVVDL